MKDKVLGSFYLKRTATGNLLGEYTNNELPYICTESADFLKGGKFPFEGLYTSTWREIEGSVICQLDIKIKEDTNNLKYRLLWKAVESEAVFEGQGFVVDGILVGNYWGTK